MTIDPLRVAGWAYRVLGKEASVARNARYRDDVNPPDDLLSRRNIDARLNRLRTEYIVKFDDYKHRAPIRASKKFVSPSLGRPTYTYT